ncbi:hypothetical protein Tco_0482561 [Tanacetum coccineum]
MCQEKPNEKVLQSSSPQNTQTPRQALHEDNQLPQTSVPIPNVANEAVFQEWDDRVVRATTTAASLDAAHASGNITKTQSMAMSNDSLSQEIGSGDRPRCQEAMGGVIAQTRSERASKHSYDSPLLRVNIPGSDEERLKQHKLTDNIPSTPHDSPLPGGHTPGSDEGRLQQEKLTDIVTALSQKVEGLESDLKKTKKLYATAFKKLINMVKSLEDELKFQKSKSKRRRLTLVTSEDEEDLVAEDSSKQGRSMIEEMDLHARISLVSPHVEVQGSMDNFGNSRILDDLTPCKDNVRVIKSAVKDKELQQMKILFNSYKQEKVECKEEFTNEACGTFSNQRKSSLLNKELKLIGTSNDILLNKRSRMSNNIKNKKEVQRLKRAGQEVLEKPVKRQKLESFSDSSIGRTCNSNLAVSYPITLGVSLKSTRSTTEPTDNKEKELWVELKRLFEPDNDDILWKLQWYMHDPLVWRLYDTCGVYHVSSVRRHDSLIWLRKNIL